MFAAVFFLWFVSHLRHVTSRAEGGAEAISPLVYGSGAVLAAVAVVQAMPGMTLAYMAHRGDSVSAGVIRMLFDMSWMANNFVAVLAGLFLVAASLAVVRREMVAPWLGWAGMLLLKPAMAWIFNRDLQLLKALVEGLVQGKTPR